MYGTKTEPGTVDYNLKSDTIIAHWRDILLSVPDAHAEYTKAFQNGWVMVVKRGRH